MRMLLLNTRRITCRLNPALTEGWFKFNKEVFMLKTKEEVTKEAWNDMSKKERNDYKDYTEFSMWYWNAIDDEENEND